MANEDENWGGGVVEEGVENQVIDQETHEEEEESQEDLGQESEEEETEETEEQEESTEEEEESEEEEINVFELALEEQEEGEEQEDKDSFDYADLSKETGVEFSDKDSLVSEIKRLQSLESQEQYANDEVKGYVERMNAIAKAGGDIRSFAEKNTDIATQEKELERSESIVKGIESLYDSRSLDDKKDYLIKRYRNDTSLSPEEQSEMIAELDDLTDAKIKFEANRLLKEHLGVEKRHAEGLKTKVGSAKSALENEERETLERVNQSKAQIKSAIDSYQDPDHKSYTPRAKKLLKGAFETKLGTYQIPEGVAQKLLLNDKGEIDVSKMMSAISSQAFGTEKKDLLKNAGKKGLFRKMTDAKGRVSKTTPKSKAPKDKWTGGAN